MKNDLHFGLFFTEILWLYGVLTFLSLPLYGDNSPGKYVKKKILWIWSDMRANKLIFLTDTIFSIKMNRNYLICLTTDISPFKPFRSFLISQINKSLRYQICLFLYI